MAKTLKPATIEQTQAAFAAESQQAPIEAKPPSMKTRMTIQSVALGVQLSGQILANKDADSEGWDDYFAFKLGQLAAEMTHFAATGMLLPTE